MKKINLLIFVSFAMSMFFLTSCRLANFTVMSSKNVSIVVKKDAQRTKAWGWTIGDALDNAIEKAGSGYDALNDGVIYSRLFGYCVKGTPIKSSEINK